MTLKKNFRMFQAGEVYDLESSKTDVTKISALGVEPDVSVFKDDNEIDPEIDPSDIEYQYSRAMRFMSGNGIVDNLSTSYSYYVSTNDILTISFYLKWHQKNTTKVYEWRQMNIYLYINRNGTIDKLRVKAFDNNFIVDYSFIKIVINNPEGEMSIQVDSNEKEYKTIINKAFNLGEDSYIYLGVDPSLQDQSPALNGIIPIIDDLRITIDEQESNDQSQINYIHKRNLIPLWIPLNVHNLNILRVY